MAEECLFLTDEALTSLAGLIGLQVSALFARALQVNTDGTIETEADGWFSLGVPIAKGPVRPPLRYVNIANSLRDVGRLWDMPCFQLSIDDAPREISIDPQNDGAITSCCSTVQLRGFGKITMIQVYQAHQYNDFDSASFDDAIKFTLDDGAAFVFAIDTSILCRVTFAQEVSAIERLLNGSTLRAEIRY